MRMNTTPVSFAYTFSTIKLTDVDSLLYTENLYWNKLYKDLFEKVVFFLHKTWVQAGPLTIV